MDLTDRFLEHDHWLTDRLLENAATLGNEALDRAVRPDFLVHDFEGPEPDVRTMLERIIFTKEVWTAVIAGRDIPARDDTTIAGLQSRHTAAAAALAALARRVRDDNAWDEVFVDRLCTPPSSFTLGGVLAHILTVGIIRRHAVIDALRTLGVTNVETRDVIEWERAMAPRG